MYKLFFLICCFFFCVLPCKGLTTSGDAVILMEEKSGRVLYSKNINKQKLIASTTKIMTAVLAIESNQLDDVVTIDESILKAYGSNIYIQIGEEMTLRDLVYGLMLRSGNDAALAIANHLGGLEHFVKKMNEKALEIGMKKTSFINPHGLDEDKSNISTAYDMALLTRYAKRYDGYSKIAGTKKHIVKTNYKTYAWTNKNKLLTSYKYTTGGKTGYTEKARRTLVTTASKNNLDLIVVTLNDGDDWNDHKKLYEYGFDNYRNYKVLNKNKFKIESDYYKEDLYIEDNYYYPLKPTETNNMSLKIKLEKIKKYKNKDKVGVVEVYYQDDLVHIENVYIKVPNYPKKSIWQIIAEWFKR